MDKMGKEKILLIEDDEIFRSTINDLLQRMGFGVLEARSGKEAVDLAKDYTGDIDLALLDIGLPDMSGLSVYPLLMAARPRLKVLVCSGHSNDGPVREILSAGGQDFIQKPFTIGVLSKKLASALSES
jgi:DNA-binding response OmpR family regulator